MAAASVPAARVSTLELFFDLVFVFAATQLSAVLAGHLTWTGVAEVVLVLAMIMWMYGGYAWLTNAIVPDSPARRALMLVGMGGFLVIALAIPGAFTSTGWAFGLGYFTAIAVHTGLFAFAGGREMVRAFRTLAPLNLASATIILVGAFAPGGWRWGLWLLAVLLQRAAPYIDPIDRFTISPSHFVERHGLIIIIALGESLVAIGVGASGVELDLPVVLVASLGLSIAYMMWWVYFGGDDARAEAALDAAGPRQRVWAAFNAYGWAYLGLLLGIVAVAAGMKKAVGHASGHLEVPQAAFLAGGLAVYLLSEAAFRRMLRIGRIRFRAVAALAALATVPLGTLSALAQVAALVVVLSGMLLLEGRSEGRHWHFHRTRP
ncbi:low temperature requirement protein A [Sphaerisporangium corydalis]|uniref:Low temperature requirement protein A n=1 Tax=Sphaerisporangium corydalis TaxID=1441875 RepID=A0ABV9EIK1_9ACTN|nr:low temperature requirement protein A [Sphaerisporangium corydalis]